MNSLGFSALGVVLNANAADAVAAVRKIETNEQQVQDAKFGALFLQMRLQDLAYYTAVLNVCTTNFHRGDGGGVYYVHHYGLAHNIERQEVNIDLVCQVLCARGFRVNDSKEYENILFVSWSPGYDGHLYINKMYIPEESSDVLTFLRAQEPVFELPEELPEDSDNEEEEPEGLR